MTTQTLNRLTKATLIERLDALQKDHSDIQERLTAAFVIGGAFGVLLGLALSSL